MSHYGTQVGCSNCEDFHTLRQARLEAHLTQVDVARSQRRQQSFVSKCESGERKVDVVETFVRDEIFYDIPHYKKSSYVPATTSITLNRGQETLAGDWYACYESIKEGKPCRLSLRRIT